MTATPAIRLATMNDAARIGEMSRDLIERGLGWNWNGARVAHSIRHRSTNVAIAEIDGDIAGFAIMRYEDDEAHLLLLAVDPSYRRRGIARALMAWHEESALVAGVGTVYLEARAGKLDTRAFYRSLGYREVQHVHKYYSRREDAVRFAKDLWAAPPVAES